jgi:hypothetical protein
MRIIAALLLTATIALGADQRAAVRVDVEGIDVDTDQHWSVMPQADYVDTVLWMPFSKEHLAGTYYDYSTAHNDGTQATAGFRPTHTNAFGGAYEFDGVDDYIMTAYVPPAGSWAGITYSVWANADSFAVGTFGFVMGGNLTDLLIRRSTVGGSIQFFDGVSDFILSDAAFPTGAWVHIACTISATDDIMRMYVNGVLQADTTVSGAWQSFSTPIRLGWSLTAGATQYFDGLIDDTRIFNRALSAAEVLAIYNATNATH